MENKTENKPKEIIKIKQDKFENFKIFLNSRKLLRIIILILLFTLYVVYRGNEVSNYEITKYEPQTIKRFANSNICIVFRPNNEMLIISLNNGKIIERHQTINETTIKENKQNGEENK